MAKIRVFELAKDLNMTNKVLLEKMRDLDISVVSHLSSLEDEDVVKIMDTVSVGKQKKAETVHVKPVVIRRRAVQEPVIDEKLPPVTVKVQPEPEITTVAIEPEEKVEADLVAEEESREEPEVLKEPSMPIEAEKPTEVQLEPMQEGEEAPDKPDEDLSKTADESSEIQAQSAEKLVLPDPLPFIPEESVKRVGKKKNKHKKELPAKIIKLAPVPVVEPPPEPAEPPKPSTEPPVGTVVTQRLNGRTEKLPDIVTRVEPEIILVTEKPQPPLNKDKDKKKKKPGKEIEEDILDKKLKKKLPFRKKEIIEGVDLYSESPKMRKAGRKVPKTKQLPVLQKPVLTTPKAIKRRIKIDDTIAVAELAKRMGIKASEIIVKMMGLGVMVTLNQVIDYETASLVSAEFNFELERAAFEEDTFLRVEKNDPEKLIERPPVVTIMGHVDHGKTSLLDVIRKTRVTEGEAGGITQHIGAYHVVTDRGQVVFLDTPGHEAFTAMRSRGASITDLVVLVVAADDGVMPQTLEAINHAKAANVPIIVAVNKIDKPGADPEKVQRELADAGLVAEEWGGTTIFVRVSAKANTGIDDLLEMILLQAEVMELKADPSRLAFGHVVEAKLDIGRGPVATVLVQQGTLRAGDAVVCGVHYGKIRALLNDRGLQVESAGPSMPVEVIGLSGVPMAGDELMVLADEKDAKQVSLHRLQKQRSRELGKTSRLSLDKLFEQMKDGLVKDLNIIIKADVHGSIEALGDSLVKLSNEEVNINIIHSATGAITESDVSLATVSDAIIIGFNVRPSAKVQAMAAEEHVDMRFYNIIYNVIKDVKDAIVGMMKSTFQERVLGRAEVRDLFHVPKVGTIAGCSVIDGKIQRGKLIRLLRDGVVAFEGKIGSLRRYKDDVKEVVSGYECGIGIENYNDIKLGDVIECYYMEELKPEVE